MSRHAIAAHLKCMYTLLLAIKKNISGYSNVVIALGNTTW